MPSLKSWPRPTSMCERSTLQQKMAFSVAESSSLVHSVMDVHRVCQALGRDTAIKHISRWSKLQDYYSHLKKPMKYSTAPILFVGGIDTNVGKTYATAFLAKYLVARGLRTITQKIIQTGWCWIKRRYRDASSPIKATLFDRG